MATKSLKLVLLILSAVLLITPSFAQGPTGTVSIYSYTPSGNLIAGPVPLQSDGTYTVASAALTSAVNAGIPVYAVYSGSSDGTYTGSTSPEVVDVITSGQIATTTTLTINPNPATVGAQQTFSGSVSANGGNIVKPPAAKK